MTQLLHHKEFSKLEHLEEEAIDINALQVELKRLLVKKKAVKQIDMVNSLLHRAKSTSENILIGNKTLPEIFEE